MKINAVVAWEAFRSRLEKVWRKPADKRKSNAGCKAWDAIVMFKAIVLCALYNLSDDQVEYQMRDRLSFVAFPDRVRGRLWVWPLKTKCPTPKPALNPVSSTGQALIQGRCGFTGNSCHSWCDRRLVRRF